MRRGRVHHFRNAGSPDNPINIAKGVSAVPQPQPMGGEAQAVELLRQIENDPLKRFAQGTFLGNAHQTLTASVTTTEGRVLRPKKPTGYLILNPASYTLGVTTGVTALATTTIASTDLDGSANYYTSAVNVAGTLEAHVFFYYTSLAANNNFRVFAQALNPVTSGYADTQNVFDTGDGNQPASTNLYAHIGSLGVASSLRFRLNRYDVSGSGNLISASIGIVLKENVGELDIAAGVARTIFLGPKGVTSGNGYPLLSGQSILLAMDSETELYAISLVSGGTNLNIWQLEG